MVREDFASKVTFEQRPRKTGRLFGRIFRAEHTGKAKA